MAGRMDMSVRARADGRRVSTGVEWPRERVRAGHVGRRRLRAAVCIAVVLVQQLQQKVGGDAGVDVCVGDGVLRSERD